MCGRSFPVRRCHLRQTNRAKFCTPECYFESRRAFSKALSDGRLDVILAEEREQAKRKRKNWKPDDFTARKLADRTDWEHREQ
jgi:hypothetical protein